jgi:hypothetical protein
MKDGSVDILIKENDMNLSEISFQNINQTINLSEIVTKDCVNKKEIYVDISDTGQEISSIILPKLFGRFVKDSDYGTGLGLYYQKNWWRLMVEEFGPITIMMDLVPPLFLVYRYIMTLKMTSDHHEFIRYCGQ